MDATQVKTKLIGYGFSLLEGIDPNAENYVCAGIIHTTTVQIGCLLRLEPNSQAQVRMKRVPFGDDNALCISKPCALCTDHMRDYVCRGYVRMSWLSYLFPYFFSPFS